MPVYEVPSGRKVLSRSDFENFVRPESPAEPPDWP
jgi:hypothetical protein